jgi:glycosyltransferase involved in cell wall biosynthesis
VRIALLGTRGVPARYGGFETAAQEIGARLVERGHEVVVYCRNPGQRATRHLGMRLVNLPAIRRKSLETLSHTGLSTVHAVARSRPDVAVVFNTANAPYVPLLRAARIATAIHLDGLEWRRAKWGPTGRRYFRVAEGWSVRLADAVIADSRAIAARIQRVHGRDCTYIPYGAPIVVAGSERLAELGLESGGYHLIVGRLEPENQADVLVSGYVRSGSTRPLVVVGSAPYAGEFARRVRSLANGRVRFLDAVWDEGLLDQLYGNCLSYLHGHSVGGTNPSLLRAMGAGAPVTAFDVVFNREVTGAAAHFFRDAPGVASSIAADEADPSVARERGEAGRTRVAERYDWADVTTGYERLCERLWGPRTGGDGLG